MALLSPLKQRLRQDSSESILHSKFSRLRECKVTIAVIGVVSVAYVVELALVQSIAPTAGHEFLSTKLINREYLAWILSPVLHSSHSHILWNIALFTPFALLTEQRGYSSVFLFYLIVVAYTGVATNQVASGGWAVGISSLSYSLQAREIVYRGDQLRQNLGIAHAVVLVIAVLLVTKGVLQAFGYLPSQQGTAHTAHFIGVLLGVVWQLFGLDELVTS